MTRVNPNNGSETNKRFFHGTYSNLTSFFLGSKIVNYFDDFCNLQLACFNFTSKLSTNK